MNVVIGPERGPRRDRHQPFLLRDASQVHPRLHPIATEDPGLVLRVEVLKTITEVKTFAEKL